MSTELLGYIWSTSLPLLSSLTFIFPNQPLSWSWLLASVLLHNYMRELREELQRAEVVTPDPRERNLLPEGRPGPFVTYVRAGTWNDEYFSFRIFLMVKYYNRYSFCRYTLIWKIQRYKDPSAKVGVTSWWNSSLFPTVRAPAPTTGTSERCSGAWLGWGWRDASSMWWGVRSLKISGELENWSNCVYDKFIIIHVTVLYTPNLTSLSCSQEKPPNVPVLVASPELISAVTQANDLYEQSLYEYGNRRRYYPAPPEVQADLLNYMWRSTSLILHLTQYNLYKNTSPNILM